MKRRQADNASSAWSWSRAQKENTHTNIFWKSYEVKLQTFHMPLITLRNLGFLTLIWCGSTNMKEKIPILEYYFVLKSFHGPATISKLQGLNAKTLLSFQESRTQHIWKGTGESENEASCLKHYLATDLKQGRLETWVHSDILHWVALHELQWIVNVVWVAFSCIHTVEAIQSNCYDTVSKDE